MEKGRAAWKRRHGSHEIRLYYSGMCRMRGFTTMTNLLQRDAVVGPNGTIEVWVPEIALGQHVRVIIESEERAQGGHAIDVLAEVSGHRLFKTARRWTHTSESSERRGSADAAGRKHQLSRYQLYHLQGRAY